VRPGGRFRALTDLLSSPVTAALVAVGASVEVHSWSRRPDGSLLCETITLTAEDFQGC
jgi:hypothetical protein